MDSGYYKFYEAYHLLKFSNEKQILEKAYNEYLDLKRSNLWGNKKYFYRQRKAWAHGCAFLFSSLFPAAWQDLWVFAGIRL